MLPPPERRGMEDTLIHRLGYDRSRGRGENQYCYQKKGTQVTEAFQRAREPKTVLGRVESRGPLSYITNLFCSVVHMEMPEGLMLPGPIKGLGPEG